MLCPRGRLIHLKNGHKQTAGGHMPDTTSNSLLGHLELESFSQLWLFAALLQFLMAGSRKLSDMDSTIAWFGNADWGLGLPLPALLA